MTEYKTLQKTRLMRFVLSGLLFHSAVIYLNDFLVSFRAFDKHLRNLEKALRILPLQSKA